MTSNSHRHAPAQVLIITTPQELAWLISSSLQRALQGFHPAEYPPESERYLTISETASYVNLAKQTLYGYTSNRTIPFIRKAKRVLFLKSDLARWLFEGRHRALPKIIPIAAGRSQPGSAARIIDLSPPISKPNHHS